MSSSQVVSKESKSAGLWLPESPVPTEVLYLAHQGPLGDVKAAKKRRRREESPNIKRQVTNEADSSKAV